MTEQAKVADIILGFEGLAILRAWMLDNATVKARTQEILDIAARIEEEPWSNPLTYGESTVTAGYAEWATTYDDPGNPMLLAEEPVVQEILARYPVGTALDAACGTGRHTEYLASLGHQVTGIDSTPEMLKLAAAKVPAAKFETADLLDLPSADGENDLAVCTLALTHCPDLGPPITELARVLRPGGHLVISDVHPFDVMLSVQGNFRRKRGGRGFVRNYVHLPSDYLNAFQAGGTQRRPVHRASLGRSGNRHNRLLQKDARTTRYRYQRSPYRDRLGVGEEFLELPFRPNHPRQTENTDTPCFGHHAASDRPFKNRCVRRPALPQDRAHRPRPQAPGSTNLESRRQPARTSRQDTWRGMPLPRP